MLPRPFFPVRECARAWEYPAFAAARASHARPIGKPGSRGCFDRCSRPGSVRQWATVYNAISIAAPSTTGKLRTSSQYRSPLSPFGCVSSRGFVLASIRSETKLHFRSRIGESSSVGVCYSFFFFFVHDEADRQRDRDETMSRATTTGNDNCQEDAGTPIGHGKCGPAGGECRCVIVSLTFEFHRAKPSDDRNVTHRGAIRTRVGASFL